jgi:metal-responsive CopG/Arc/MetJ family transcriptional regulator
MDHIVSVGLDTDTLKQLDDLRRANPNIPSRSEIIKRLIWAAHAKIAVAVPAPASASDLAG